jgi:hypothetical protein
MGIRMYVHNIHWLYSEYRTVVFTTGFGFIFLIPGVVLLLQKSLMSIIFIATGLSLFIVGWYSLKQKGTPASCRTIVVRPEDLPAWKQWMLSVVIVLVFLTIIWLIAEGILNGRTAG